jgi:uncharacterized protein YjbI with pentapeptide repeats
MTPDDTTSARPDHPPIGDYTPPPSGEKFAFISYKREDQPRVGPIVEKLRKNGIPVWWDQDLPAGSDWPAEIKQHLDDAQVVVAVWSEKSVSPQGRMVQEEARAALEPRRLLPIAIDRVKPPFGFGDVQAIDMSKWAERETDPAFVSLVTQVGDQLHIDIPTPPPPTIWDRIREHRIKIVAVSLALAGGLSGLYAFTAPPTTETLYKRIADRNYPKDDRAAAIHTLFLHQKNDSALVPENHRQVVQFLAWRAKRPALIDCDAPESRLKAGELLREPDVDSAVAYLRSTRRTRVPNGMLSLDSVNLQKQDFSGADLRHITLRSACLDDAKFSGALLMGSVLDSAHLSRSSFARAHVDSAQFGLTQLDGSDWFYACLRHANFAGANLKDATLQRAIITWANFSDAYGRVSSGWTVVDTTDKSNALFVGTKDVAPDERALLERAGAAFIGDFDQWNTRRAAATADAGARACRPPV